MPRTPVQVRLSETGLTLIDRLVKRTGRSRSDVIRAALAVAAQHEKDILTQLAGLGAM